MIVEPRAWHREVVHEVFVEGWKTQLAGVLLPVDWPGPHCLHSFVPITRFLVCVSPVLALGKQWWMSQSLFLWRQVECGGADTNKGSALTLCVECIGEEQEDSHCSVLIFLFMVTGH